MSSFKPKAVAYSSVPDFQYRSKRKSVEKPPVRPKPAYLRDWGLGAYSRRARDGVWAKRLRQALAADLLQGRCQTVDNALASFNNYFDMNNKALQEACSLLEEQLIDLEKLSDIHEVKNKDLEGEVQRMRCELSAVSERLSEAERTAGERAAAATAAEQQHGAARDQARASAAQLQRLRERLESREAMVASLEARLATLEGERSAAAAALGAAARRVRELQEECAGLRTRAHQHHSAALQLQGALAEAQEELVSAREAAEAATAWWRTRETKADATLRQQAKLIDFLQAKVEEAGRKKCSLSNKLFGRSGRRPAASPPLRRANRELREEVDRLRAKLAASTTFNGDDMPPTPRREKPKPVVNGVKSIDTPDGAEDSSHLQIVWRDGSRDRMRARVSDGALVLGSGAGEVRARLLAACAAGLPHNEASRAFAIKLENSAKGTEASVVCSDMASRQDWLARLAPAPPPPPATDYAPAVLKTLASKPVTALYLAENAVAIGCSDGLHSLRGPLRLEAEGADGAPCAVRCAARCGGRALLAAGGALYEGSAAALESALRRAPGLEPAFSVTRVQLAETAAPHLLRAVSDGDSDFACAAACGRRVVVLARESGAVRAARALTVDRAPAALLLTRGALLVAGDKPLRLPLPAGALEPFALADPTVAAAARKRSPPRAILLIRRDPLELLLCYAECGVFVDERGRRTRPEDPKWSSAVHEFEFVAPFLYAVGENKITIVHIGDEAYKAPPCTCDTNSVASSASEFYMPEVFNLAVDEPGLLGTAPHGILVRVKRGDDYEVSLIEGAAAFRSVGASLESLATASARGSCSDLAGSAADLRDGSEDSAEAATGFLADIRTRARQLRAKNRQEGRRDLPPDDVIKQILTTEVGLQRPSGRKSPAPTSEFDSDSDSDSERSPDTADLCAEMFTRQVRFQ